MNMWIQIGVGLVPALIVVLILLFKRKAFGFKPICATVLLAGACITSTVVGITSMVGEGAFESKLSKKEYLGFAAALAQEGAYEEASEVLQEYSMSYGYDDSCRLLAARIDFLQEDYTRANGLYTYLCENTKLIDADADEVVYAALMCGSGQSDLATIYYLTSIGEDVTEYGYTTAQAKEIESDLTMDLTEITEGIQNAIAEAYKITEEMEDGAHVVAVLDEVSELTDEEEREEKLKNIRRKLDNIQEEYPELFELACLDEARLYVYVLDGDFEELASLASEASSYGTQMVLAELYMKGLVDQEDFPEEYQGLDSDSVALLQEQLDTVYEKNEDDLSKEDREDLEERVEAIKDEVEDGVIATLKEELVEAAETETTDQSKIYMEVAKIENYIQNESSTEDYLREAIETAQNSDDDTYADAMGHIYSLITDTADEEDIKNVTEYAQSALEHSLTVDVVETIEAAEEENASESEDDSYDDYDYDYDDYDYDFDDDDYDDYDDYDYGDYGDYGDDDDNDDDWSNFGIGGNSSHDSSDSSSNSSSNSSNSSDNEASFNESSSSSESKTSSTKTMEQIIAEYVGKIRSAINIGHIDTDDFEEITAKVQITSDNYDTAEELTKALTVTDCGVTIDDFSLEKIEYEGANIYLLCDVSGSMDGSVDDLQSAVEGFIEARGPEESIGIGMFSDYLTSTMDFSDDNEALLEYADGLYAWGGTNMYDAVLDCLDTFEQKDGYDNILILMTDGDDNYRRSAEEIYENIGTLAEEKGVTIYTLGLGEGVVTDYLTTIANAGGGDFMYVSDSASLESFYDLIHSQMYNQYTLTYRAEDTMTLTGRVLSLALNQEKLSDKKTYSLYDETDDSSVNLEVTNGKSITGISPSYLYKTSVDTVVKLKGTGFVDTDTVSVKLNGNLDYELEATFVDENSFEFTVPSSIAVGTYNVEITINGKTKIITNGFSVMTPGSEKRMSCGPYVFTSALQIEGLDGSTTLRGNVTMNGWLHFRGDVTIYGEEEDASFRVTDYSGSYITYDASTASGLAKYFADKGIELDLPALYEFTLYNDSKHLYDYDDYQVDNIYPGAMTIFQIVRFDAPSVKLYPDSIGLYYNSSTACLPFMSKIIDTVSGGDDPFSVDASGSLMLTDRKIGCKISVDYEEDSSTFKEATLFGSKLYMNNDFKLEIDTIKEEYTVGAKVALLFFADDSKVGLEISWNKDEDVNKLVVDSVTMSLSLKDGIKLPTTIPIEMNDFEVSVSDGLQKAVEGRQSFTKLTITGKATLSTGSVADEIPGLEKWIGDVSVLSMPDTTISLCLNPIKIQATAELDLFEEITLAKAGVSIGVFDYSSTLLGVDSETVAGVSASLTTGIMWESDNGNISVNLSGTGELDAHSRFVGAIVSGTAAYNFEWWIIDVGTEKSGDVAMGIYTTHSGEKEFVFVIASTNSNGKVKKTCYTINAKGKTGKGGTLS